MHHEAAKDEPRPYLAAYALCLDRHSRLLLCRLNTGCIEAGYWTLPGGGVNWGESPDDAVARELQEETGLRPSGVSLISRIYSEVYPKTEDGPAGPVHHVGLLYRVRELTGTLRAERTGTTDHCAWFTREEAEQLPLTLLGQFALGIAWSKKDEASPTDRAESAGE